MNCSKCGKPLAVGASTCGACGTAAASGGYSYDLLPEEEPKGKKTEEAPAFMLPPGVSAPPSGGPEAKPARVSRADRPRAASLNSGGLPLKQLGLGAAVLLILVLLGMRMCGGPSVKLTMMSNKGTGNAMVSNNNTKAIPFQLVGETTYRFKVESLDDEVRIGVPERGSRDKITADVVKTWTLTPVKKGETQVLEGKLSSGSYSLVIVTDSKKMVRAKYEFEVKK